MATLFLLVAIFQLLILRKALIVEGNNSSVWFSNATSPTSSNGIDNKPMSLNTTSNSTSTVVSKSTSKPTTHTSMTLTSGPGVIKGSMKSGLSSASSTENDAVQMPGKTISTKPVVSDPSATKESDDEGGVPYWVYILIAFGVIFVITIVMCVIYARLERWKTQGSYMVWDDNELELSPAFTRESEFLLDSLATNQEPGTPELQIYEIPLDSLGHQRVYIGTKRIAPKSEEHREAVKFTKNKKSRKKDAQFQGNTLPRAGKRDHIYSSVNDEVSSALSDGDLFEGRNVNGCTTPPVILSCQTLGKSSSLKPMFNGRSPSPEELDLKIRSFTLGSRTKSVSNIFQNRPLPPAPSKRFSKSLDRLRFFEISQNRGKSGTYPSHQKSPPMRAHPMLVKSSSFGGTYNKIICRSPSLPPVPPPPRKGSMGCIDKLAAYDISDARKTNLCRRHSKSLDTLLLLREINWTAFDVDIYHPYESVPGNQVGENNNIVEPSYASVSSDEKASRSESSGRASSQSKASTRSASPIESDTPEDNAEEDHPYASVTEDNERPKTGSLNGWDQRYSNRDSDGRDSGVSSAMLEPDSDPASPYASVRISQIPGLVASQCRSSTGEESNYGEVFENEDSGSSIGTCKDLKECVDSKRSSTHTYLELIPDSCRNSVVSETSSGYARPIDIISSKPDASDSTELDNKNRQSLTDLQIPNERSGTLESTCSGRDTLPCAFNNKGITLIVEDNLQNHERRDQTDESRVGPCEKDSTVSELSYQEPQASDVVENVDGTKRDPEQQGASLSPSEHVYEEADYVQSLRNLERCKRSDSTSSDTIVNIQGVNLRGTCHTDEFVV